MVRNVAASYWTAAGLGALLVGLHAWWFSRSAHQGDVVTGFGGALTVVGIIVAAQPYIRKGLVQTAREQVGLHDVEERKRVTGERSADVEAEGVAHVLKERVIAAVLIGLGSSLNAYGPAIARLFSLRDG